MTDIYNVQIHLGLAKTITSDQHMLAELSTILLQTEHYASSHGWTTGINYIYLYDVRSGIY